MDAFDSVDEIVKRVSFNENKTHSRRAMPFIVTYMVMFTHKAAI